MPSLNPQTFISACLAKISREKNFWKQTLTAPKRSPLLPIWKRRAFSYANQQIIP